jgi:3-dehydroquinate dehydratase-1
MLMLGRLPLDGSVPLLVASFGNGEHTAIDEAVQHGLDVAELRIDLYEDVRPTSVLSEIAKFKKLPTLGTIRAQDEGGSWTQNEAARLKLFRAIAPHVDAIDVELRAGIRDEVLALAKDAGKLAILSFHDFHYTPPLDALIGYVDQAKALGADVVKIATFARDDADVATLAHLLLQKRDANLIVIAMGPAGVKSRVFFPALGSLLTFAALNQPTAPGQLPIVEMFRELRFYYPRFNEKKGVDLQIVEAI